LIARVLSGAVMLPSPQEMQDQVASTLLPHISCRANYMRMPLNVGLQYIKRLARIAGTTNPLMDDVTDA
jgi:hypothetical protein